MLWDKLGKNINPLYITNISINKQIMKISRKINRNKEKSIYRNIDKSRLNKIMESNEWNKFNNIFCFENKMIYYENVCCHRCKSVFLD